MAFVAPKPRPALFRGTPPAIFPVMMGLFGLGLGWRRGADAFGLPAETGELLLGAVTALYLFGLAAYLRKLLARPAVLAEELRILPGRAGVGAMVLCLYLLAATALPYAPGLARGLLFTALALHGVFVAVLVGVLLSGPAEQRRVTPVWHLNFVGFILAGLSAPALGHAALGEALLWGTGALALAIWAESLRQFLVRSVPQPLRPLLAIHLAPAAMLGLVATALGQGALAQACAGLAAVLLGALVLSFRWLTAAGFSPFWGAFTFPLAATASLWLTLVGAWRLPGGLALVAATLVVPPIAFLVLRLWARGQLGPKTGAAVA